MLNKILWVDDEIELLKPHIIFLSEKGYEVITATNGEDAIDLFKEKDVNLVFLDEMMPGMGGLEVLGKLKEIDSNIPVVMITKNEEESLMNEAIGSKITDYLTKPVNPSQVFLVCKKLLEGKKISNEFATKDYLQDFQQISFLLSQDLDFNDWTEIYLKLVNWDLELSSISDSGMLQTFNEQKKECNKEFCKYIERNYKKWITTNKENTPKLTLDIIPEYVLPELKNGEQTVFLFVIDCLRYDQWLVMEKLLIDFFKIDKEFYYSILPTATAYARNTLFAGLYPSEIERYYPDLWQSTNDDDEKSMNKYEKDLLQLLLDRRRIKLRNDLKYIKIIDPEVGRNFEQNILSYQNTNLTAVVVNFLDMIAHGRSDSDLLKEIAPDEAAYRSLTNSWFQHSSLLSTFKSISKIKNSKIIITTDHGSIRALRGAKVLGDKETSTNLRFKFGRNLKVDEKHAIYIKDPLEYKLPRRGITTSYIIAKEDFYFVYPTDYHKYLSYYKDTFQHGGISMEEMILPVIKMEPK